MHTVLTVNTCSSSQGRERILNVNSYHVLSYFAAISRHCYTVVKLISVFSNGEVKRSADAVEW